MSTGYLVSLAGNFAIFILSQGRVVSGWLPSVSGTPKSDVFLVGGLSSQTFEESLIKNFLPLFA